MLYIVAVQLLSNGLTQSESNDLEIMYKCNVLQKLRYVCIDGLICYGINSFAENTSSFFFLVHWSLLKNY